MWSRIGCVRKTRWSIWAFPNFKGVEFDPLLAEAGSNAFTMSPTRWVELTSAIGIITKNGAGGGTYAQRDIAFKFANWVSVEFELYLVMEFQRLKAEEQELLGWTAKRELSKINYRIHTDAISNMENINAVLINDGMPQGERLIKLNQIAIQQMQVLESNSGRNLLK